MCMALFLKVGRRRDERDVRPEQRARSKEQRETENTTVERGKRSKGRAMNENDMKFVFCKSKTRKTKTFRLRIVNVYVLHV